MRTPPIALITVASACAVLAIVAAVPARDVAVAALVAVVTTCPQAVLLWAHAQRARSWLQDLWLAAWAVVLALATSLAVFVTAWLHVPVRWLLAFGTLSTLLAAACALALGIKWSRRSPHGSS